MELQSIGLAGLEKAQEKLSAVAKRLSTAGAPATSYSDSVDLSSDVVALLEATNLTKVNLKLVETANELASQTIDILA